MASSNLMSNVPGSRISGWNGLPPEILTWKTINQEVESMNYIRYVMEMIEEKEEIPIVELGDHLYFVGFQFHPEFKSRPGKPSALFLGVPNQMDELVLSCGWKGELWLDTKVLGERMYSAFEQMSASYVVGHTPYYCLQQKQKVVLICICCLDSPLIKEMEEAS
ncbi:unnamed protein product [Lactuca saligna]|uniref:CTP synthase (glutamine hydrolyzing) n=1 Tax=Lactuca saligna TaxID=75948 RepID=A0AA35Y719_LACSI|nr:unnamed protein product [Lactuca saligna]